MRLPALRLPAFRPSFGWLDNLGGRSTWLYALYTVVLFLVFALVNFPHHVLVERMLKSIDLPGMRLDVADTRFAWWHGFELEKVRLTPMDPDRPAFLELGSLFVRPGLAGLFKGKINSAHLAGLLYGGGVDADLSAADGTQRAAVNFDGLQLQRYPLLTSLLDQGVVAGLLSGVVTVENQGGDNGEVRAAGELALDRASIADVKINDIFTIPTLHFDKTTAKFSMQNSRLDVQELDATGPEIKLSVSGQIALREPLADSVLNLKVVAVPGPNPTDEAKGLLALIPPLGKGAKPDAPHVLTGTLKSPRFR
jgi:type II secretion system protein N